MSDPTNDPYVAERTRLASLHADLTARVEELQASKDAVRARLLELGAGPAGPLRVTVTPVRRLNAARFQATYAYEDHPEYYETKPVAAIAKALGDPTVYDEGTPQLRVVEAD